MNTTRTDAPPFLLDFNEMYERSLDDLRSDQRYTDGKNLFHKLLSERDLTALIDDIIGYFRGDEQHIQRQFGERECLINYVFPVLEQAGCPELIDQIETRRYYKQHQRKVDFIEQKVRPLDAAFEELQSIAFYLYTFIESEILRQNLEMPKPMIEEGVIEGCARSTDVAAQRRPE